MKQTEPAKKTPGLRVAIVQHFLSHYREPLFNLLCRKAPPYPVYVFFADTIGRDQIKTIPFEKAQIPPQEGGLRWQKLSNLWIGKTFLWQSGLVRLALDRSVDCIVYLGNPYHLSTWLSAFVARLAGKRVLMWTHGYLQEESGLKGWVREVFYRLADGFLLYGNRARDIMIRRGFDPRRLYVVYNSLDVDKQKQIRKSTTQETLDGLKKQFFKQPELPTILFIGRLTSQKKLPQLLESLILLEKNGTRFNALLVGDGPERNVLEQFVADVGLKDQVHFFGPCYSEDEIGPLIMLSDVCVSPGEVGLTCMHSFAYGTPVITHDEPDHQMPEWEAIRPGYRGALFRRDDVHDLAATMDSFLKDKVALEAQRRNCIEIIEQFYNAEYQAEIIDAAVRGLPAPATEPADTRISRQAGE